MEQCQRNPSQRLCGLAGMDGYDEVDSLWLCNGKMMERVLGEC